MANLEHLNVFIKVSNFVDSEIEMLVEQVLRLLSLKDTLLYQDKYLQRLWNNTTRFYLNS